MPQRALALLLLLAGVDARKTRVPGMMSGSTSAAAASPVAAHSKVASGKSARPADCLGAGAFDSAAALSDFLVEHGIDAAAWPGNERAKSAASLFTELELGETQLEIIGGASNRGVRRLIRVVKVRVTRPGAPNECLVEARQVFADGRVRTRGKPLSEKIFPHEDALGAATRGVLEEVGPAMAEAEEDAVWLDAESLETWIEIKGSSSYPDLMTRYELWTVDAVVHGIPAEPFETLENCAGNAASSVVEAALVRNGFAYVWSGATLRRRRRRARGIKPPAERLLKPEPAFSASGVPLELPQDLLHQWEWLPAKTLAASEAKRRRAAAVQEVQPDQQTATPASVVTDDYFGADEASGSLAMDAAALSEDTGGCVMFVSTDGNYSVVCPGGSDIYDD